MEYLNYNFEKITTGIKKTIIIPLIESMLIGCFFLIYIFGNKLGASILNILNTQILNSDIAINITFLNMSLEMKIIAVISMLVIGSLLEDILFIIGFNSPINFIINPVALFIKQLNYNSFSKYCKYFNKQIAIDDFIEIDEIVDSFIDKNSEIENSDLIIGCKKAKKDVYKYNQYVFITKGLIISLGLIFIVNKLIGFNTTLEFYTQICGLLILIMYYFIFLNKYLQIYAVYTRQKIQCFIIEKYEDIDIFNISLEEKIKIQAIFLDIKKNAEILCPLLLEFQLRAIKSEINTAIEIRNSLIDWFKKRKKR